MGKKELVYVCSPLFAATIEEIEENMKKAGYYAALITKQFGCRAIAPHSFLPQYLDDNIPQEREVALAFGLSVLKITRAVVICGNHISNGMKVEIEKAKELGIPVYRLWENETGVVVVKDKEEIMTCDADL